MSETPKDLVGTYNKDAHGKSCGCILCVGKWPKGTSLAWREATVWLVRAQAGDAVAAHLPALTDEE